MGIVKGPAALDQGDADFADYLRARWPRLVAALEAEGVPGDAARLAVTEVLLVRRRGWRRLVREEQVDVVVWRDVRERLGLPVTPKAAPPDVPVDPAGVPDSADEWLPRADASLRNERTRRVRRGVVFLLAVVTVLAGLSLWEARPRPPAVREEVNPLPVVWYAAGELHLAEVVVEVRGIDAFVARDDGAAVRHTDGRVVLVGPDGTVRDLDREPADLASPRAAPAYEGGRYDNVVQSVPVPAGGWAHLIDSSRRAASGEALRLSESGRRALVLCAEDGTCGAPRTVLVGGGSIRLR